MKRLLTIIFAAFVIVPTAALAHGPSRQKVVETITVDAAPDKVWAVISDFGAIHEWHPAIKTSEMDGDSTRVVTLDAEGDPTITEELKTSDDEKMMLKYKIADQTIVKSVDFREVTYEVPVVPVENYLSIMTVKAAEGGSEVTWTGKFYRVYQLNYYKDEPRYPQGLGDDEAIEAVTAIYKTGLENLKQVIEGS